MKSPSRSADNVSDPVTSTFIIELGSKLRWAHRELMSRFQCGDDTKEW